MSKRVLLYTSILILSSIAFAETKDSVELSEKQRQAVYEQMKQKVKSNEERAAGLEVGLKGENKAIGNALQDYAETQSPESLSIIAKVLAPESQSAMIFATLLELPINTETYPLLLEFIEGSNSRYRSTAVERLTFAPFNLGMDEAEVTELLIFLDSLASDINGPDPRLALTAKRISTRLKETPYIESAEAKRKRIRETKATEKLIAETPSISAKAIEFISTTEEITPPEPAIEEPTEVVVAEPVEEEVEQSPKWWLWLIGAVIAFGCVSLVFRKKN